MVSAVLEVEYVVESAFCRIVDGGGGCKDVFESFLKDDGHAVDLLCSGKGDFDLVQAMMFGGFYFREEKRFNVRQ